MSSSTSVGFATGLEKFGKLNWDDEFDELVASAPAISENSVAAGLDTQFGKLSWDDEFEELVEDKPAVQFAVQSTVQPTVQSTATSASEDLEIKANAVLAADAPESDHNQQQNTSDLAAPEPVLTAPSPPSAYPPGWATTESPSWYQGTQTSPEVSLWASSPDIFQEASWTLDSAQHDVVDDDVPRVASILRRAFVQLYPVPLDSGVHLPHGASGQKDHLRWHGANVIYRRGAKGLKEPGDVDIPKERYLPNGVTTRKLPPAGTRAFYPQPSRLSQVQTIESPAAEENNTSSAPSAEKETLTIPGEKLEKEFIAEPESIEDSCSPESVASYETESTDSTDGSISTSITSLSSCWSSLDEDENHAELEDDEDFSTKTKLATINERVLQYLIHDGCDHAGFGDSTTRMLPDIPSGYRWTASSYAPVHEGPRLIVQDNLSDASRGDKSGCNYDSDTSNLIGIDDEISHLEIMSDISLSNLSIQNTDGLDVASITTDDRSGPVMVDDIVRAGNTSLDSNSVRILFGLSNVIEAENNKAIMAALPFADAKIDIHDTMTSEVALSLGEQNKIAGNSSEPVVQDASDIHTGFFSAMVAIGKGLWDAALKISLVLA